MFRTLLTAAAVSALMAGSALPASAWAQDAAVAEGLRDKALRDHLAWDITEDLTTNIGPRVVGSPAMEKAKDWGVAKFKALGFTNIKGGKVSRQSIESYLTRHPEIKAIYEKARKKGD